MDGRGFLAGRRWIEPQGRAGTRPVIRARIRLRRWALPLACSLALFALMPFWHDSLIRTDTPMFGFMGWPQVNKGLPWVLVASLWVLDFRLLRPSPYLALAGGYILIASLRGIWWDYYFLEISILCLLIALDGFPHGYLQSYRPGGFRALRPLPSPCGVPPWPCWPRSWPAIPPTHIS